MNSHSLLVLFGKPPVPGRVKTRLAKSLGATEAAAVYRALCEDLLNRLAGGPWQLVWAGDPGWSVAEYRNWLPQLDRVWEQSGEDLGLRLKDAFFRGALETSAGVIVIGTDLPHLCLEQLRLGFEQLRQDQADLVLGPAEDGGYYLVGMNRPLEIFDEIAWSSSRVLSQTLARAGERGWRVGLLQSEADIDTESDWLRLKSRFVRGELLATEFPRTARLCLD